MTFSSIILLALSTLITGLCAWGVAKLTAWLDTKIEDKRAVSMLTNVALVVTNSVQATYQTYVEAAKGTELWDKDAQKKAQKMALDKAKSSLKEESTNWIIQNFGDLDSFLTDMIESKIYELKK